MKIPSILKLTRKKVLFLIIPLLISGFIFYFFGRTKDQGQIFVQVKKQDISFTVFSSGSITGKEVVNLKFKSSGTLSYINVRAGDSINIYEPVASLDTRLLEIDLQQALNTYRDKQALAEKAEDDVKDHSKDETFAQRASRTTAQSARDSAYDEVKAARKALDDTTLFSPIAGIVTQASFVAGQNVTSADTIAQIVNISSIYFDTEVDEADIGKISLGQKAEVTLDAFPDKIFSGLVDQIIPQTKTTSSGATVVLVRIKLDDPPSHFINNLAGQSSIIISKVENALTIPLEALRDDEVVFIKTKEGLTEKKVIRGIQSETEVEIKEGLSEEDQVLLNPLP